MVELFNLPSDNAKKYVLKCNDHHKAMILAMIAREAITKELLVPYARQVMKSGDSDLSCVISEVYYECTQSELRIYV